MYVCRVPHSMDISGVRRKKRGLLRTVEGWGGPLQATTFQSRTLRNSRVQKSSLAFQMVIQVYLSSQRCRTYWTVCSTGSQLLDIAHMVFCKIASYVHHSLTTLIVKVIIILFQCFYLMLLTNFSSRISFKILQLFPSFLPFSLSFLSCPSKAPHLSSVI